MHTRLCVYVYVSVRLRVCRTPPQDECMCVHMGVRVGVRVYWVCVSTTMTAKAADAIVVEATWGICRSGQRQSGLSYTGLSPDGLCHNCRSHAV